MGVPIVDMNCFKILMITLNIFNQTDYEASKVYADGLETKASLVHWFAIVSVTKLLYHKIRFPYRYVSSCTGHTTLY